MPPIPLIDPQNPFYCPGVSAAAFIKSLRARRRTNPHGRKTKAQLAAVSSFAQLLAQALLSEDDCADFGTPLASHISPANLKKCDFRVDGRLPSVLCSSNRFTKFTPMVVRDSLKRKRTLSFSDLRGPPKHLRSCPADSADGSTFLELDDDITPSCEKEYRSPDVGLRPTGEDNLQDILYGPPIGSETPTSLSTLLDRLDSLMPGIRLKQRLQNLESLSHQTIADFLGQNGYLTPQVLNMLRASEVTSLCLSRSLSDHEGLNLASRDILPVFSKPNSFFFLTSLSFVDTPLQDFDLTHIIRLPRLSTLLLQNLGIGDEAVFLLLPLKYTLKTLSLARNPQITDESIPAIRLLASLNFLSIFETSIGMPGLRLLAQTIESESRIIDIEIPSECETYIDCLDTLYLVDVKPPLIADWRLCARLSGAALKRNLMAHASVNPDVSTGGTKMEMKERLESLLKVREGDLRVRGMIWNVEDA